MSFSKFYTSFLREHKPLRYTINPFYWVYRVVKFSSHTNEKFELKSIGLDAKIIEPADGPKKLIIVVVGEAARSDRFEINGYSRPTNPLLKQEDIISFTKFFSCGTSTAVSVPCMFSYFTREDYNHKKGISTQNVSDVLKNTKDVQILWRDNNSDSKGVALRVEYQDFKTKEINTICDDECGDEGMLVGLDEFIAKNDGKDMLIVLHQMGNHGPAYYKRYPKEFEKFTPVCKTNQLENCSKEEINNAYDNAILYTDYFLSKVINFLKPYSKRYETEMLYISDHGESLGENGIYLHGLPYTFAPDSQKHVPAILWFGDIMKLDYDTNQIRSRADREFSQDYLFNTILGLFKVQSEVYDKKLDILDGTKLD